MHRLLTRQLARHGVTEVPQPLATLFAAIENAYAQADEDRELLERSLDLTSKELLQRNAELRADIAGREKAERRLRKSEARLRGILGALPDVLIVLSRDYVVRDVHVPPGGSDVLATSTIHGRALPTVLGEEVFERVAPVVDAALSGRRVPAVEVAVTIAGRQRHLELRLCACDDDHVVMIIRDQTERTHLIESLRAADRMASVGMLAASVAHEINNPLTYVLTNLDHIASALAGDPSTVAADARQALDEARLGAERVRQTVRDVGLFSHPGGGPVRPVVVEEVLDSVFRMARNEIRPRATVVRDYNRGAAVEVNEARLSQVFLNLVVNAAQALPIGGAATHRIIVRTESRPGETVIDVSDTGPGIPDDLRERVFEPFVTTKAAGEGTGLGLSICRRLVEESGGELSVFPRQPNGTTFRVVLPTARRHVPTTVRADRRLDHDPPMASARVLIVDDDPLVATAMARALRPLRPDVANDSIEALSRIRDDGYDIVLCDLMMPEVSGIELFRRVASMDPGTAQRFVFMTGGLFTQEARDFVSKASNPVLYKPIDVAHLRRVVHEAAARSGEGPQARDAVP